MLVGRRLCLAEFVFGCSKSLCRTGERGEHRTKERKESSVVVGDLQHLQQNCFDGVRFDV